MHTAKRPLTLLIGAAGASMSGYLYLGEDQHQLLTAESTTANQENQKSTTKVARKSIERPISKQELGLQQSLARELACWISSASVYAARQAFYASSSSQYSMAQPQALIAGVNREERVMKTSSVYHGMFGWLQQLSEAQQWDANQVIHSSSFSMLLNVISGAGNLSLRGELEEEMYRAVGTLATNGQCAAVIAERATRYGKHALLNLAQRHERDPRVGHALHRLVVLDGSDCRFGAANLVSLMSLAVADVPDEYLEFALWGLSKAASPLSVTRAGKWRKTLFGDDSTAKTRRKLLASDKLWGALVDFGSQRSEKVQLQAARLLHELSSDPQVVDAMHRHQGSTELLMQWLTSSRIPLVCASLGIIANVAQLDEDIRSQLLLMGALDVIRVQLLENKDRRMTANLLSALRWIAEPIITGSDMFALDQDALSFVKDPDTEDPLHHDDLVNPSYFATNNYVDGWIELFTAFLKSDDKSVRDQATMCLQQISTNGSHKHQGIQEWLIAVLDAVLEQVPREVANASTSVRDARSRTRPIVGHQSATSAYEISHAKALRALAFVLDRKECQRELVRLGGVPLLKILMRSENHLVQRETARVLANLFMCDDVVYGLADFALHDEELAEVLETWTHSKDIQLQSLAHRARSNRRYQINRANGFTEGGDVKYLDGVHPLHFSPVVRGNNTSDDPLTGDYDVDVVFIHGLLGCPYETWICGEDESIAWSQEWLLKDLKADGCNPRVLSIGYDSRLLASESAWQTKSFEGTSQEILKSLNTARVGAGDRPVIFVTHSLGGVLLKQVLLDSTVSKSLDANSSSSDLIDQVRGVMFYGVPHHGSPVAQTIQTFKPRRLEQHPVTEHLHGTPHLKMLNDWCAKLFEEKNIPALSVGETLPCRLPVIGVEALVVPPISANPGFGEFVLVSDSTHVDVCKPISQSDIRYTLARKFISDHAVKETCITTLDVE